MTASPGRSAGMDALRSAMMLLVVLFHAALPYMTSDGPEKFKDSDTSIVFDLFVYFLVSFNMPLFFMTAGFFAALIIDREGLAGFIRNRTIRILIPLVIAWTVLPPLTRGAYTFAEEASTGSIAAGLDALGQMRWVRWNKMYHLWFLVVLLVLYVLGLLFRYSFLKLPSESRRVVAASVFRWLTLSARPVILAAILWLEILPAEFASGKFDKVALLVPALVTFFLLGSAIFESGNVEALRPRARIYLVIGLALLPIAAGARYMSLATGAGWPAILGASASFCLMSGFMVFGLTGFFLAEFRRPHAVIRYLSDASYWIYLVHLPLVVAVGGAFSTTQLPVAVKFIGTITISAPILILSYHYMVRATPVGGLLNGRRTPRVSDGQSIRGDLRQPEG